MWFSGLGIIPQSRRSLVWNPVSAHAWIAGSVPVGVGGTYQSMFLSHIDVSLSFSFLFPLSKI